MKWHIHSENKYLQLLVVLVFTFLLSPFLEELSGEFPFLSLALLCSIIFTLRALELKRMERCIFDVLKLCHADDPWLWRRISGQQDGDGDDQSGGGGGADVSCHIRCKDGGTSHNASATQQHIS